MLVVKEAHPRRAGDNPPDGFIRILCTEGTHRSTAVVIRAAAVSKQGGSPDLSKARNGRRSL
jgi:hypothetical protein